MTGLCVGRPPQWWETGDDNNRLALALCRRCPIRQGTHCELKVETRPTGMIVAGVAYSDRREPLQLCLCGYPKNGSRPLCVRCDPPMDYFRLTIERWMSLGHGTVKIGRWLGYHPDSVKEACQRWGLVRAPALETSKPARWPTKKRLGPGAGWFATRVTRTVASQTDAPTRKAA